MIEINSNEASSRPMRKPQNILKLSDTPDGRTDRDLIHPLAIVRNIKVRERKKERDCGGEDESFKRSGDRNATPPGAGRRRVEIIKFINVNVEIRFFFWPVSHVRVTDGLTLNSWCNMYTQVVEFPSESLNITRDGHCHGSVSITSTRFSVGGRYGGEQPILPPPSLYYRREGVGL
jgi:hypothetical protein